MRHHIPTWSVTSSKCYFSNNIQTKWCHSTLTIFDSRNPRENKKNAWSNGGKFNCVRAFSGLSLPPAIHSLMNSYFFLSKKYPTSRSTCQRFPNELLNIQLSKLENNFLFKIIICWLIYYSFCNEMGRGGVYLELYGIPIFCLRKNLSFKP